MDFCNSFWGLDDVGVDVLFARMQSAAQTIEDLNGFWKERASIEEDYANRLAKLAEMTLGGDEIGDLRKSLDAIRADIKLQAEFHLLLAQQLRSKFEVPTTTFHARQLHHKKTRQAGVEKLFTEKLYREFYFSKTRDIYEQECVGIDAMKAQTTLVQGKELERINTKLERAKVVIHVKERDYSNFLMALKETVMEWEQEWKSFCDTCQDMEEDRMKFMKDAFLNYANAVSTACLAADASCRSMRVTFERMKGKKYVKDFAWEYGTGDQIPDPDFFTHADGTPSALAQRTSRTAEFVRSTSREPLRQNSDDSIPLQEGPVANIAGIGDEGATAFQNNEPYTSESAVDDFPELTAALSGVQQIPDTHGIQLSASMTNQNGGVEALKQMEELQVSVSQNTRSPDSMVPKLTQPVGAEVAQASVADHEVALLGEHTSLTPRRHSPSPSQVFTGGGGAPFPTATIQQDQPIQVAGYSGWENGLQHSVTLATAISGSNERPQQQQMLTVQRQLQRMDHGANLVWRSPSQLLPRSLDNVLDSDPAKESRECYDSAVDHPEGMPLMSGILPQTPGGLNLFMKQRHQRNASNSNVNPINFEIKKRMKTRRIVFRTDSTSESSISMKLDTESYISCSSG